MPSYDHDMANNLVFEQMCKTGNTPSASVVLNLPNYTVVCTKSTTHIRYQVMIADIRGPNIVWQLTIVSIFKGNNQNNSSQSKSLGATYCL